MATLPKALADPKTVTYEEWLRMPEVQDATEEVVNGEIRIMPPNKSPHAKIVQNLLSAFVKQVDEDAVQILGSQFGLVVRRDPLTCRTPDLALYWKRSMVEEEGLFLSAPELVVEVLSPSNTRREREEKIRDYESLGVPEVWVVSPEARTVEVLQLHEGALRRTALLADGQLRPAHFPEAVIDIPSIWPK